MKNDCIFCAIAAGEIPSCKIWEDDVAVAYLDINPCSPGHTLVVPREHVRGLLDADDALLAALVPRVRKVAAHLKEKLPCDGFNILQNNGACAGQSVFHLHFHIVPRKDGGPGGLSFASSPASPAALQELAARLKMD